MTARFDAVDELARSLVASLLEAPATLGSTRLVCVDGPAGSGKTTLGEALRRTVRDSGRRKVALVHMDNVYAGWSGMAAGMLVVAEDVVGPLRDDRPGRYRRYDWDRDAYAEERLVEPSDVLVVEGVGSGNAAYADSIGCLVWVEAPPDVALARGLARDGEELRDKWLRWRQEESEMFAAHRTRERADVLVDGRTGQRSSW